jgi:hypothetical protein
VVESKSKVVRSDACPAKHLLTHTDVSENLLAHDGALVLATRHAHNAALVLTTGHALHGALVLASGHLGLHD